VIEAYEKHWNTEDETYQKLLTEWTDTMQCFRDSIQTNSVQTEVRRFSLEGEKNLSGGQQKRLSLAIILINRPDLILDEPTNLDLEMIEWLETYFAKKTLLFMVTHDRFFLERVCNEIIELDNGKLYFYKETTLII
jgi:ATP-binding cassette subfamily F protein uup